MSSVTQKHESFYLPVPFDPIKYVKQLESVGFTREQAEMQSKTFFSIVQEQLVTKQDLKNSENALIQVIKEIEAKTSLEFEAIRRANALEINSNNQSELFRRDLKMMLVLWLVTLVVLLSAMFTLIPH